MTAWAWAPLCLIGAVLLGTLGDLLHDEIRGWLDLVPHAVLRLAASRLNVCQRGAIYEEEWLPELCYVLRGAESRPITRLIRGITFAIGLLIAAPRIAREISRDAPSLPSHDVSVLPVLPALLQSVPTPIARERTPPGLTSFNAFYDLYYPKLTRFLISYGGSSGGLAEDVAQDAMIAACEKWDNLLTYERPDAWLFKVAIRMLRRAEGRIKEGSWPEDLASTDRRNSATADESAETRIYLVAAIRDLPRRQAEVIGLRFLRDCTLAETARILGLTEAAVSAHQRRGLERLRQQLGPQRNE
jgi:RNA polymerase sigma factor (sigma-70 family)